MTVVHDELPIPINSPASAFGIIYGFRLISLYRANPTNPTPKQQKPSGVWSLTENAVWGGISLGCSLLDSAAL
jgi:hypothetical protein